MKKYLLLFILNFSFTFSNVKAQCPEGDVQLFFQGEVDWFVQTYPNCTHITGNLYIGEFNTATNIDDISGLSNITTVDGHLGIYTTHLIDLNGLQNLNSIGGSLIVLMNDDLLSISQLSNLTQINGRLSIGENYFLPNLNGLENIISVQGALRIIQNDRIESIEALSNVVYVGEFLSIGSNPLLESLSGLDNIEQVGGSILVQNNESITTLDPIKNIDLNLMSEEDRGLYVELNNNLTTCNLPNICEYLSFNPTEYPREIFENTGNCTDEQAVLAACGLGINDVENNATNWSVVYQKNTGSFLIQTSGFQLAEIEVYDLSGKLIKSFQNLNSNQEELRVFTPENVLVIKVKSKEGKVFAKKVLMK